MFTYAYIVGKSLQTSARRPRTHYLLTADHCTVKIELFLFAAIFAGASTFIQHCLLEKCIAQLNQCRVPILVNP